MNKSWIRLIIAISIDGRIAFPAGGKSQIGGKGDRKTLEESLSWADATLIGGETLRAHQNICLIHNKKLIQKRILNGKSEQPIALVVSNKQDHCLSLPFFQQPIERWLLHSRLERNHLSQVNGYKKAITLGSQWGETIETLSKTGLNKIAVLGGAKICSSLLSEDQIDELRITICPKVIGGKYSWVPLDHSLPVNLQEKNAWLLEKTKRLEDNEISLIYYRNRSH